MNVYLIAKTTINEAEIVKWLEGLGGVERLAKMTGSPGAKLIELAGRRCYLSFVAGLNPNVTRTRDTSESFHANLIEQRHGSVFEHVTGTFAFEKCSRVFTHELVRHRAGCAHSQESLRYRRLDDFNAPPPPELNARIAGEWNHLTSSIRDMLRDWIKRLDMDSLDFGLKKKLTSAIRRIVPMGVETGIVTTFNIRALRWVIQMRTQPAAEREMREAFRTVFDIAVREWPFLFADFEISAEGWCKPATAEKI